MKCPKCGAENPDSAEYCSLCMEKLLKLDSGIQQSGKSGAPGDLYIAPGEWRGDADVLRTSVSKVVETKVKKWRVRLAIYGVIILLVVIWLVLSFTMWGNPSPGKASTQLLDTINARNQEGFVALFEDKYKDTATNLYEQIVTYLGTGGRYENIDMDVVEASVYDAASYIESGNIVIGGGSSVSISSLDNLVITLENHYGKWYVVPKGTNLIP
ncbi:MAG: zinc ribbon domain-containing protein [Actinobacteria bacterium]|nr:zinc ribbon domain-containing protein [Actinomycetota bacterium]